jgi:hypothetical protein
MTNNSTNIIILAYFYSVCIFTPLCYLEKPTQHSLISDDVRSPDQNVKHITPPNGSDNVYAVVDKRSKDVHTTNGGKEEGTCQPDQTYAVVDKTRKRKSSQDETNKKKFEINSGNR